MKSPTIPLVTATDRNRMRALRMRFRVLQGRLRPERVAVPYLVLVSGLVIALLLNIGIGAVSVEPNQVIWIVGHHLRHVLIRLPGWGVVAWLGGAIAAVPGAHPAGAAVLALGDVRPISWLVDWLHPAVNRQQDAVVWSIRVPRMLMGCFAGAGLAVSGAALQGIFRNPLADPGLIGVSTGASLGAVIAIVLNIGIWGIWTLPAFAFGGAMLVTLLVYLIARHEGKTEVVTLLLAGVAINAMIGAGVGLLITRANDQEIRSVTFWTMGSLGGALWNQSGIVFLATTIGVGVILRFAQALNLFVLGEREARHLGVRVERSRAIVMFTTAAMTGASVAFTGAIGFVGLVVPHLVRLWLGPDHRRLLPCAALLGATLMLFADLAARTIVQPMELPIGVVTSLIGGPFFIWLLLRTRRQQGGWA